MPRKLEFNNGPMDGQTMLVADDTPQIMEMVFVTPAQGPGDTEDRWTWQTRHEYVCYVSDDLSEINDHAYSVDHFEHHSSRREKVGAGGIENYDATPPAPGFVPRVEFGEE